MTAPRNTYHFEFMLRFNQVLRSVNLTLNEWICDHALLKADRPISENSLALIVGIPRTTVRTYIEKGLKRGILHRTPGIGISLTPVGKLILLKLADQAFAITEGRQTGFDDEMISILEIAWEQDFKGRNTRSPFENAKTIGFLPLLTFPVESRHS